MNKANKSDKIMESIASWDETPEGKAFRAANDIRKPQPEHKAGCPAQPGYGHALEPCICKAVTGEGNVPRETDDDGKITREEWRALALSRYSLMVRAQAQCDKAEFELERVQQQLKVEQQDHQKAVHRLLKTEAQRDELLAALKEATAHINGARA